MVGKEFIRFLGLIVISFYFVWGIVVFSFFFVEEIKRKRLYGEDCGVKFIVFLLDLE